MRIGFIGTGVIGGAYAKDFKERGFDIVQYSLEKKYEKNGSEIAKCDITFIAVPTPTKHGQNTYAIKKSLKLIGKNKIAVIKSTILPSTTDMLQEKFPDIYLFHSPEFLRAKSAEEDAKNPERNILGFTNKSNKARIVAKVMEVLPKAPYVLITEAKTAELIKYASNTFLFLKVVYANILYDMCQKLGTDYGEIKEAISADKRIGGSHLEIFIEGGRGAGGMCFPKDVEALKYLMRHLVLDEHSQSFIQEATLKNIKLLKHSFKDIEILNDIYGELH